MNQPLKSQLRTSINGSIRKHGLCPASINDGTETGVQCKHGESARGKEHSHSSAGRLWWHGKSTAQHTGGSLENCSQQRT